MYFQFLPSELLQIAGLASSPPGSSLGTSAQQQQQQQEESKRPSDILDATTHELKLEKSNILMLGPTGCGMLFNHLHYYQYAYGVWPYTTAIFFSLQI